MPLRKQGTLIKVATAITFSAAIAGASAQTASAGLLSSLFAPKAAAPVATTPVAAPAPVPTTPAAAPTTPTPTTPTAATTSSNPSTGLLGAAGGLVSTAAATVDTVSNTVTAVVPAAGAIVGAVTSSVLAPVDATKPTCKEEATTKAFAKYGDNADYSPAPNGRFEDATVGWKLGTGASIVRGNDTTGVTTGTKSLKLNMGAVATSPEFCVSEANPHFRYVAKPGFFFSTYQALVLYRDSAGKLTQAQFVSSSDTKLFPGVWGPSSISPLATKIPLLSGGNTATVQIVLTSLTGGAHIDSVMVDPYRRG